MDPAADDGSGVMIPLVLMLSPYWDWGWDANDKCEYCEPAEVGLLAGPKLPDRECALLPPLPDNPPVINRGRDSCGAAWLPMGVAM
jgi:hypothetical protein